MFKVFRSWSLKTFLIIIFLFVYDFDEFISYRYIFTLDCVYQVIYLQGLQIFELTYREILDVLWVENIFFIPFYHEPHIFSSFYKMTLFQYTFQKYLNFMVLIFEIDLLLLRFVVLNHFGLHSIFYIVIVDLLKILHFLIISK